MPRVITKFKNYDTLTTIIPFFGAIAVLGVHHFQLHNISRDQFILVIVQIIQGYLTNKIKQNHASN